MREQDLIVVGAGMVGAAIAYGAARRGLRVLALDGRDRDHRAARANFGLVWLQGKGAGMPAYRKLTRRSTDMWPAFGEELAACSGIDLAYERNGGLSFCLGEAAFTARREALQTLVDQGGGEPDFDMLERPALERLLPRARLGPEVVGASFGRYDGHANPLHLLDALHRGLARNGGSLLGEHPVGRIVPEQDGYRVQARGSSFAAPRLVIAAGLGSAALARDVGLEIPLRPQRGQLLVTERVAPLLPLPASGLRQTAEGTVMVGSTREETGLDAGTTIAAAARMSTTAIRTLPALSDATLVRHWAGLRPMTPDGHPVYVRAPSGPGAFVALCHSGVTLAALHAEVIAGAVAAGDLPDDLAPFHHRRFDVPKAA